MNREHRFRHVGIAAIVFGASAFAACASGGGGGIGPLEDAGGGGDGAGGGDARVDGCPEKMPTSGAACAAAAGKSCPYDCDNGGPGSATCVSGKWNVQLSEMQCPPPPPPPGPTKCGTTTCTENQYCVQPCCGGPAPACTPLPDSGICPAGTSPGSCPGSGTSGCVEGPCTPAPPYCIDSPSNAPNDCTLEGSTRKYICQCA